jgi:hypothetical protein
VSDLPAEFALNDDEFEARLRDPTLITTHDEAIGILDEIDRSLAHIQTQIDAYAIESNGREMPPERQAWLRRAAYAGAMRRNERYRIIQRDKEIRGTKGLAQTPRKDPAIGIAKQQRLMVEADARKADKLAAHARQQVLIEDIAERRSAARMFIDVARERLTSNDFEAILNEAKRRRKESGGAT